MVVDLHAIRSGTVQIVWYRWLYQNEWIELGNPSFAAAGESVFLLPAFGPDPALGDV